MFIIIIALLIIDKGSEETVLCICFCRMLPASVIVKVFKEITAEVFIRNVNSICPLGSVNKTETDTKIGQIKTCSENENITSVVHY